MTHTAEKTLAWMAALKEDIDPVCRTVFRRAGGVKATSDSIREALDQVVVAGTVDSDSISEDERHSDAYLTSNQYLDKMRSATIKLAQAIAGQNKEELTPQSLRKAFAFLWQNPTQRQSAFGPSRN